MYDSFEMILGNGFGQAYTEIIEDTQSGFKVRLLAEPRR